MKLSDIKVGEEYAAGKGRYGFRPDRVRVIAVGVKLKGRRDGVQIEPLDHETGEPKTKNRWWTRCTSYRGKGDALYTRGMSIIRPWPEEEAIWKEKQRKKEAAVKAEAERDEKRGALRAKLHALTGGQDGGLQGSTWENEQVEIDLDFLMVLVERLENAERELRKRRMIG